MMKDSKYDHINMPIHHTKLLSEMLLKLHSYAVSVTFRCTKIYVVVLTATLYTLASIQPFCTVIIPKHMSFKFHKR